MDVDSVYSYEGGGGGRGLSIVYHPVIRLFVYNLSI